MHIASLASIVASAALAGSLLGNSGCFLSHACDGSAHASVEVSVVDATGAPVRDATVTYSVAGDPQRPCAPWDTSGYSCGWEVSGHFVIEVTRGSAKQVATADVSEGDCHVNSAPVTVTLAGP